MLKKFALITLLGCLLLGTANVYGTQPQAMSAAYFDSLNVLQIVFDQPVYSDPDRVIRDEITIGGYFREKYEEFSLTGGTLNSAPGSLELSDTVEITVTFDDQKGIERLGYDSYQGLWLVMPTLRFINEDLEGNVAVSKSEDVKINFVPYYKKPTPVNVIYDAATNKLGIKFNIPVQTKDDVELTKISLGDPNSTIIFSSLQQYIGQITPSDSVIIDINPKHQQQIESFDIENLILNLEEYSFLDELGNTNEVVSVPITFLADTEPTEVDSANYSEKDNKLTIYFNEKIVTTYKRYFYDNGEKDDEPIDAIKPKGITLVDTENNIAITLEGVRNPKVSSNIILELTVEPDDQIKIETLQNTNALKLTIDKFSVLDEHLNGVRDFTLDDNISISYTPEEDTDKPVVAEASYNAVTNHLDLSFDNVTNKNKGIDTLLVNFSGIQFVNTVGETVALDTGKVHGFEERRQIKDISIEILPQDEAKIEKMADKDNIYLALKPFTFLFQSNKTTGNGNKALPADSLLSVNYTPDSVAANIIFVKYDYLENSLNLHFNKQINYSEFDFTALTIGGVNLSGNTSIDSSYAVEVSDSAYTNEYTYNMTCSVTPADSISLASLDWDTKADMSVSITAGTFTNFESIPNVAKTFKDGDLTAAGDTVFVGYGRSFWTRSFRTSNPPPPIQVNSSLKGVGDHCYIYVADNQWYNTKFPPDRPVEVLFPQNHVFPVHIDSLLYYFEENTPDPNSTKGIYDTCVELFGNVKNTDGDERITIFLYNVRDNYQAYAEAGTGIDMKIYRPGYFDTENEHALSSRYPISNELDMLYLDSWPSIETGTIYLGLSKVFTQMILNNVDSDEEQWLVEGLSSMAEVLTGYRYSNFQTPQDPQKDISAAVANSLFYWSNDASTVGLTDLNSSYMIMLYLYDHYGIELLKSIAADSLNGIVSIDSKLAELEIEESFSQVFDNYAIASFINGYEHAVYGDKYGFKNLTLGIPGQEELNWEDSDSKASIDLIVPTPQWASRYYKMDSRYVPDVLRFNGNNESKMDVYVVTREENFEVLKMNMDTTYNESTIDLSAYKAKNLVVVVTSKSEDGPTNSDYVIAKDNSVPDYVDLAVFQNPSVDNCINIYVVSKEQIYRDVPAIGQEGPIVTISVGNESTELMVPPSFENYSQSMYSYNLEYLLTGDGTYNLVLSGQDMAGNNVTPDSVSLAVLKVIADRGGSINLAAASLFIPPKSIGKDTYFTLQVDEDKVQEQISYHFGPSDIKLKQQATLTLPYEASEYPEAIAVYRLDNSGWVREGGVVNKDNNTITITVEKLGEFSVMAGEPDEQPVVNLPEAYNLAQNYPNPFNPTTNIQYALPYASKVTLCVYNMLGQKVITLLDKQSNAGFFQIQWNASNKTSGIYFYKLTAQSLENGEKFTRIRKMMVIK